MSDSRKHKHTSKSKHKSDPGSEHKSKHTHKHKQESKHESKQAPILEHIGYVLDLDQNIVEIQIKRGDPHSMSESAAKALSVSETGQIEKPELMPGQFAFSATAFRRKEWEDFFNRVIAINERYQKLTGDEKPFISIVFLTNATYTEAEFITNVFKKFFGEEITKKLFDQGARYYNQADQFKVLGQGIKHKGAFMGNIFEDLKEVTGISKKEDWTLVDDSYENIKGMEEHGFSGIHHPSNPALRPPGISFTEHGGSVFQKMYAKIDAAEEKLNTLEKGDTHTHRPREKK